MAKLAVSTINSLALAIVVIMVCINGYLTIQNKKFSDKQQIYIETLIQEKADLMAKFKEMQAVDDRQTKLIERLINDRKD